VDVKDYNLKDLRKKMGLVMQEPTLFNYTVKENILYGHDTATDTEVREAASIANALEFIESNDLLKAYDDNFVALHEAFVEHKDAIVLRVGNEPYNSKLQILSKLSANELKAGKFKSVKGEVDDRSEKYKDINLHKGFDIECGIRGGKLSGGQKQRVAIARAVIRKPKILILDEATSALDENSQKKVQVALNNIMVGRTSIVIAHRLTTIESCSRLVVIADGVVAEEGNFTELKNAEGGYFASIAAGIKKTEANEKLRVKNAK